LQRKLELAEGEPNTHIRAKYLRALEDDRFDILPATVYAKGFLRSYADYLGLDGSRFVDE
jgi:cytoskeletal protein RodZ